MNHTVTITKRLVIYTTGLFCIALGATFSILANLGVSPVTSLPYALALIGGVSVGTTTVIANALFILIQVILLKEIQWKNLSIQLLITFIFGFFMDFTIWLTSFLPKADSIFWITLYFSLSLVVVACSLLFYMTVNLPTMPYDTLTHVVASKWHIPFGKAKIICDLLNVFVSLVLCLVLLQSFGAIGIGTFIAAYAIGKIVGIFLHRFQPGLKRWVFSS